MSRPIKFRAWDKVQKKMYLGVEGFYDGLGYDDYPTKCSGSFGDFIDNESIELMQFTGLTDRNGKEIFEGDIVQHHWHKQMCIATWSESRSQFDLRFGEKDWYPLWPIDSNQFEVLGNVHENKELLP